MIPLTGYANRLSVRPDETISFHVSHHHHTGGDNKNDDNDSHQVQTQVVRVTSADPHTQPGPGIQTTSLSQAVVVECLQEPRPETTQLGSHAEIPLHNELFRDHLAMDGLTFVTNICPTWLDGQQKQCIASTWKEC